MLKMNWLIIHICCLILFIPDFTLANPDCCTTKDINEVVITRDDLGGENLAEAIRASLRFLYRQPETRIYHFCEQEYNVQELITSLNDFLFISSQNFTTDEFLKTLHEKFDVCEAIGQTENSNILVTGYFEPLLEGSLHKEPPFLYPLYSKPDNLVTIDGRIGRIQDDHLVPYWSRAQIEKDQVLQGNELVFVSNPVEAFILHVQGSSQIRLRDGSIRRIQFAAKNGLPYRSIGKLLVEQGKMALNKVTLPAIENHLNSHPDEIDNILHYNQSFIFFKWGQDSNEAPLGSLGEPLTPGRSVALDHNCFPPGALGFLKTRKPIFNTENNIIGWAPLQRFVLNQDTGSAITGESRVDLFLGGGVQARTTAGLMKHPGTLYFLIKKK